MLMEFAERITANTIATGDAAMTTIAATIPTTEAATTIGGGEFHGPGNRKGLTNL
jgi:hypothetical protein